MVRKSNPSRALEIIYDIQPLHLEILKVGLSSYIRLNKYIDKLNYLYSSKSYNKNCTISKWKDISNKANLLAITTDIINESYRTKLFKINTDSFHGGNKNLKRSQFNIYTDGSKLEGKFGVGYSIYKYRKQIYANSAQLPSGQSGV